MESITKKAIIIQTYYRKYIIKKNILFLFNKGIINTSLNFIKYSKLLLNKEVINSMNKILLLFNKINNKTYQIKPRIILSAFMFNNYTLELIGSDANDMDNLLIEYSKRINLLFIKLKENILTQNEYILLHSFLNDYEFLFEQWKEQDKYRSIQNIIISYYNRREHIKYIKNTTNDIDLIDPLQQECELLLNSIYKIDKTYNIENLKENYVDIFINIKTTMNKLLTDIRKQFNTAYIKFLSDELNTGNKAVIFNLIIETNQHILKIVPKKMTNSIEKKLNTYKYLQLLEDGKFNDTLRNYLIFMVDTIMNCDAPVNDNDNKTWKSQCTLLFNDDNYIYNLPILLLDINMRIDRILNNINLFNL